MKPRRVVITGVGVVTPIGTGREQFWDGLQDQVSRVGPITRFDPSPFRTRMAGEVPDFRPGDHIEARRVRRFDRFAQFGVAATRLAIADADLDLVAGGLRPDRLQHGHRPRRRRAGRGGAWQLHARRPPCRGSLARARRVRRRRQLQRRDRVRPVRSQHHQRHELRLRQHGHRRRVPRDRARRCRRHAQRRHRGPARPALLRRLRRHSRHVDPQRRSRHREPAVRPGA